jgi:hypothetical protein
MLKQAASFPSANAFANALREGEKQKSNNAWNIMLHREGG